MHWSKFVGAIFCAALASCSSQQLGINKTAGSALAGSALGAGLGAIVGSTSGHAGPGIAIGAATGALGGALIGNTMENQDRQTADMQRRLDLQQAQIDENERLIRELRGRGADARSTERGVLVNLPDVLFEFDRAGLTPEAERTARDIADVARTAQQRTIAIEGHTDSKGSDDYNLRLSERRAESVAGELERNGVAHGRMRVRGYGERRPIASNEQADGRARNRRVEVIIEN